MKKILILFVLLLMSMEVVTMAPKVNRPLQDQRTVPQRGSSPTRNVPAWLSGQSGGGSNPFAGGNVGGGTGGGNNPFAGANAGGGGPSPYNAQVGGGYTPQTGAGAGYNPNRPPNPFASGQIGGGTNRAVNKPNSPIAPNPFTGAQSGAGFTNQPISDPNNPFAGAQSGAGYTNAPIPENPFVGAQLGGGADQTILRGDGPTLSDILRGLSMTPTPGAAPTPPTPGSNGFGSDYGGNWSRRRGGRGGGGGGWGGGGGGYSDSPAWLNQYLNLNSWNI